MADYKNEFGWFAERPQVEKKIYDQISVFIGLADLPCPGHVSPVANTWGRPWRRPTPKLDTPAIQQLADKDKQVRHAHGLRCGPTTCSC